MHFLHVVGARPNFMKAAPLWRALQGQTLRQTVVHSGQHYDRCMSQIFFEQLGLPEPDVNLQVGSGTHAQQTAAILSRFEPIVLEKRPDAVIVYGDVNSTVAAALVCAKLGVPLVHVEAGLRSFDRSMPEEINRRLTDQIADVLLTPSADASANLLRENINRERVHLVGNIMIDTLVQLLPAARRAFPQIAAKHNLERFGLVTLHRPSNVDDTDKLNSLLAALDAIAADLPLIFPVHPRTRQRLLHSGWTSAGVHLVEPLNYLECLALQQAAALVITDSGGMQEETTYLGVPCLTVRENTERPVTVTIGSNTLVGCDPERLKLEARQIIGGAGKRGAIPPFWDGNTALRIAEVLCAGSKLHDAVSDADLVIR